jgi:hypothetical protein
MIILLILNWYCFLKLSKRKTITAQKIMIVKIEFKVFVMKYPPFFSQII